MKLDQPDDKIEQLSWNSLYLVTFIVAIAYPSMEWLFIITKSSFLSTFSFLDQILPLLFSVSLFSIISMALVSLPGLANLLPIFKGRKTLLIQLASFEPAVVLAVITLLMVDNFTYTLFNFGIVSTSGIIRGIYAMLFVVAIWFFQRYIIRRVSRLSVQRQSPGNNKILIPVIAGLLLVFLIIPFLGSKIVQSSILNNNPSKLKIRPNILYITSDGMLASHFSLYGYTRATTPNLDKLSASSLVVENDFSNADNTAGSLVSILTGKYPAKTRVLYPPNILRGIDSTEHLPGILKTYGYHSVMISHPYYADPYVLNFQNSFDEANGRQAFISPILTRINQVVPANEAYFIYEIGNRLSDRLRHIFFVKQMENPYDLVTEPPTYLQDKPMIDRLMELLKDTRQPLYVQMHMLGTHGATFEPRQQVFSNGQDILTQGKFSTDFFDDSILDMDAYLGTIIEKLRGSNLLDSTIIIVGSDHSQRTTPAIQRIMTSVRIPLLIRFPKGAHAGRININIQNMDVTPTILDYLGLNKPDWMKGQSILQTISPNRPIFAVTASGKDRETGPIALNPEKIKPPFYQFGSVSAVVCDSWYLLDLKNFEWLSGKVSGSTTSCTPQDQVNDERAYKMMVNHLKDNGFDTSSLESITPYLIQNDNAQP